MRASSVVGLVGSPMSIETSSEFEQATITFNYNEDELGDTDEDDLGILWYNEEDGEFVLLDPYLDTTHNRVSVDTNPLVLTWSLIKQNGTSYGVES